MVQFWSAFTADQRRNIAIYTLGIMMYKFALEYFNGSFITQANERFGARRFEKIAVSPEPTMPLNALARSSSLR